MRFFVNAPAGQHQWPLQHHTNGATDHDTLDSWFPSSTRKTGSSRHKSIRNYTMEINNQPYTVVRSVHWPLERVSVAHDVRDNFPSFSMCRPLQIDSSANLPQSYQNKLIRTGNVSATIQQPPSMHGKGHFLCCHWKCPGAPQQQCFQLNQNVFTISKIGYGLSPILWFSSYWCFPIVTSLESSSSWRSSWCGALTRASSKFVVQRFLFD